MVQRCDCKGYAADESARRDRRSGSRQSSRGAPPRKTPWKETHPMVLLTLRRPGGYLSAVLLAALFAALLLLLTGAPASAAQGHHKRGQHSTKRRGTHGQAKRAGNDKPPGAAEGLGQLN